MLKYFTAAILVASGLSVTSAAAHGFAPARLGDYCKFFEDRDFKGASYSVKHTEGLGHTLGLHDKISSIACAKGCTATVFLAVYMDGRAGVFQGRHSTLSKPFDNSISSLTVMCATKS